MLLKKKNQTVLIKTYTFESGLWYLAKTLGDALLLEGHSVIYIPKSKYIFKDRMYGREYPSPKNPTEFKGNIIARFTSSKTVASQVLTTIVKYDVDCIISFETLMEKANWIHKIKRQTGVDIIDIPMIEWVTPHFLKNKSYNIFDEIWTLNKIATKLFKDNNYKQVRPVTWDFVDRNLFYKASRNEDDKVIFYHQASLNPNYSTKNTDKVLDAFDKMLEEYSDIKLILTGNISNKRSLKIVEKHANIEYINETFHRENIADIYRNVDCVVAPSSREGLGLFLFEAPACGCEVITTDTSPMNEYNFKYLCQTEGIKKDKSLIPIAKINSKEIYNQILKFYRDIKNG